MKLSISNIAWSSEYDEEIYKYLYELGYNGIEIAPTRIISERPYSHKKEMEKFSTALKNKYKLSISSMQSIWYGKQGNIFNEKDSKEFIEYTKKAIDFAELIKCNNLVFGCPKNRIIPDGKTLEDIIYFFKILGTYAGEHKTIIAIEPNPTIYGTNFINYTKQAFDFVKEINSNAIKVNVDLGTIIQNKENLSDIYDNIHLVNHIHVSEPNLEKIKKRNIHKILIENLKKLNYDKYLSIEMRNLGNIEEVKEIITYLKDIAKD